MTQLELPFMKDLPEVPVDYEAIGKQIGVLLNQKQEAYGNAFGEMQKIINVLYPQGIAPYQYKNLLTLVRILDKVFRIANSPDGENDLMNEDPWRDIAGYSILALSDVEKINK